MTKFIFSLGLIALGLIVGQILRHLVSKGTLRDNESVSRNIKSVQRFAILVINPMIVLLAFWIVKVTDLKYAALPVIGVAATLLGGALAIIGSKMLELGRKQTGSMFVSGSFSNVSSFGGLICFIFFGEMSYAFVSMYNLFIEFTFYTVGFPIAKSYSDCFNKDDKRGRSILKLLLDPYILVSFTSIAVGSILNLSGYERPDVFSTVNSILIPLASFLLVTTASFFMRFGSVNNYIKECLVISIIKFLLVPVSITTTAYLIGLGELADGLILKVVLIMSSMPPAFNSLIPPQIYGLDIDLANSSWIFNTAALFMVLPAVYAIEVFLF